MKCKNWIYLLLAALWLSPLAAFAQAPAPAAAAPAPATPPPPTLEQRVTDIEAYFGNVAPTTKLKDASGPGHNGWMMTCSALVLFMTLPGLALFYGGLVRSKNVLSVVAQCFGIAGIVTILWWAFGYSLVFGSNFNSGIFGGSEYFFLKGVGPAPNTGYSAWISQSVFCMYQLMFAIITPALIVGAIAERMKFSGIMLFVILWMFLVYFPLAHMVWGGTGLMNGVWNGDAKIPAIDFAGGTVVHMSSGWSALILCLLLGKRLGFGKQPMPPHNLVLCMIGTGMLWVGWYGFNAGSSLAADGISANAFMTTTLATAVACFTWAFIEYVKKGTPSVLGFCSGAVAGLVVVTPACGFISSTGAVVLGVLAGAVPYFACTKIKSMFGYDDALDTFGVHAVGGTLGALLTGILVNVDVNANLVTDVTKKNGLAALAQNGGLWGAQLKAMIITIIMAVVATLVITAITKAITGIRPTAEVEEQGLDINEHGEEAYNS